MGAEAVEAVSAALERTLPVGTEGIAVVAAGAAAAAVGTIRQARYLASFGADVRGTVHEWAHRAATTDQRRRGSLVTLMAEVT